MKNESEQSGSRLIAKDATSSPKPLLLQPSRVASRSRAPGNYRKYRSIRIDNEMEQIGSNSLTGSAKLLKNNIALSAAHVGAAIKRAAPRGLCGLFRAGA